MKGRQLGKREEARQQRYRDKQRRTQQLRKQMDMASIKNLDVTLNVDTKEFQESIERLTTKIREGIIVMPGPDFWRQEYQQQPYDTRNLQRNVNQCAAVLYEDINKTYRSSLMRTGKRVSAEKMDFDFAFCCGKNTPNAVADAIGRRDRYVPLAAYEPQTVGFPMMPEEGPLTKEDFEVQQINYDVTTVGNFLDMVSRRSRAPFEVVVDIYRSEALKEYGMAMERADRFRGDKGFNLAPDMTFELKPVAFTYASGGPVTNSIDEAKMIQAKARAMLEQKMRVMEERLQNEISKRVVSNNPGIQVSFDTELTQEKFDELRAFFGQMGAAGVSATAAAKSMRDALVRLAPPDSEIEEDVEVFETNNAKVMVKTTRIKPAKVAAPKKRAIDL